MALRARALYREIKDEIKDEINEIMEIKEIKEIDEINENYRAPPWAVQFWGGPFFGHVWVVFGSPFWDPTNWHWGRWTFLDLQYVGFDQNRTFVRQLSGMTASK